MPDTNNVFASIAPRQTMLLVLLLTFLAAIPRFYNLGELSFYGDEETTSFPSRSVALGESPKMPSGMPYYRSLPHTLMNAVSAKLFGLKNEFSYRLPAAILGTLTIPLIFLLARPWFGTTAALIAALLLSMSEWHIINSRLARMYAPFLLFYIYSVFAILNWAKRDSPANFINASIAFILAATMHNLGVLAALIPLVALSVKGYAKTSQIKLILFSIIGGLSAFAYGKYFVSAPFDEWKIIQGISITETGDTNLLAPLLPGNLILGINGILGAILGIWLARKSAVDDHDEGREFRILTRYLLAIIAGWFAGTGMLYGSAVFILIILLLLDGTIKNYITRSWQPLLALAILFSISLASLMHDAGVIAGLKTSVQFPYPYWITMGEISFSMALFFAASLVFIAFGNHSHTGNYTLLIALTALFPLVLVGLVEKWAPARYLLQSYPFIILFSAVMLVTLVNHLLRNNYARYIAGIIAVSGFFGGHGVFALYKVMSIEHGTEYNQASLIFPVYPDHKHPGEYVAARLQENDIVVAEDILQQQWYTGRADYWLRDYVQESEFLYRDDDGYLHDIYTNSIAATPAALTSLSNDRSRRVWLITSAETFFAREYYLSEMQQQWLQDIEDSITPVFTGKDNITRVYCLHCEPAGVSGL